MIAILVIFVAILNLP